MSTTTTRLALTKPDSSETVDVTILNGDFDTIDKSVGFTPCTSSTRPSVPFNGQGIYEGDTNRPYLYKTATTTWQLIGPMVAAIGFGGDVTITSNATLTAVSALVLPVEKNTNYALDGFLIYSSATAANIKFDLTVPSGAQYVATGGGVSAATTATAGSMERAVAYNAGWTAGAAGVGVNMASNPSAYVTVGATAGSVQLRFAQATSTASNTVLLGGSWIRMARI